METTDSQIVQKHGFHHHLYAWVVVLVIMVFLVVFLVAVREVFFNNAAPAYYRMVTY